MSRRRLPRPVRYLAAVGRAMARGRLAVIMAANIAAVAVMAAESWRAGWIG